LPVIVAGFVRLSPLSNAFAHVWPFPAIARLSFRVVNLHFFTLEPLYLTGVARLVAGRGMPCDVSCGRCYYCTTYVRAGAAIRRFPRTEKTADVIR
jgi:hypothetical protein